MAPDEYYNSLTDAQKRAFAKRAKTTVKYIERAIVVPFEQRRMPRRESIDNYVRASQGAFTIYDVLAYFYDLPDLYRFKGRS